MQKIYYEEQKEKISILGNCIGGRALFRVRWQASFILSFDSVGKFLCVL